ncbi:hypothetical protein FOL46_001531, partial [Perkinsus olseni]
MPDNALVSEVVLQSLAATAVQYQPVPAWSPLSNGLSEVSVKRIKQMASVMDMPWDIYLGRMAGLLQTLKFKGHSPVEANTYKFVVIAKGEYNSSWSKLRRSGGWDGDREDGGRCDE